MTEPALQRNITADDIIDEIISLDTEIKKLQKKKKGFEDDLDSFLGAQVGGQLADNDYGCGTANLETENYTVKAVVAKKVDWSQDGLKQAYETLKKSDENPDEYIKTKFDISEAAYKNWPEKICKFFEPSRTVKTAPIKYSFERKEENGDN